MEAILKNLKNQVGLNINPRDKGINMFCRICGSSYSANSGDYFMINDPEYKFKCCNEVMILGRDINYFEAI